MSAPRTSYRMDPAEDVILLGDELREGMWVLIEDTAVRAGSEAPEDVQLRAQRFCQVTRLRRHGGIVTFIGEWVDGYQQTRSVHVGHAWIVKRNSLPSAQD